MENFPQKFSPSMYVHIFRIDSPMRESTQMHSASLGVCKAATSNWQINIDVILALHSENYPLRSFPVYAAYTTVHFYDHLYSLRVKDRCLY